MMTHGELKEFAPRPASGDAAKNWDAYTVALTEHIGSLCAEFGIDTALELQHFMAQIGHESGGFTVLWEDMRYSAPRIMQIFGVGKHSAKVTVDESRELAGNAQALAERVYGLGNPRKAKELGNKDPGDGYKYRGFGPMQITGRTDHERLLHGDHTAYGALRAAFSEWTEKDCNECAARDDLKTITKRINGGYNGIEDRKRYLAKAKRIWPRFPGTEPPTVTTAAIVAVSGKASAAQSIVTGAKVVGGAAAIVEVADPLAKATEQITTINAFTGALATFSGFVKAHAVLGLIVMAVVCWYFGRHIIAKIIEDFKSGRYMPSKGTPATQEAKP